MSALAPGPDPRSDLSRRRLATGLVLSVLAHAVLLSLRFNVPDIGIGSLTRLVVRLVPQEAPPPVLDRVDAAVSEAAPAAADLPAPGAPMPPPSGFRLVPPRPVARPAPAVPAKPPRAAARHSAPRRRPAARDVLSERVIAQDVKPDSVFSVPLPSPDELGMDATALRAGTDDGVGTAATRTDSVAPVGIEAPPVPLAPAEPPTMAPVLENAGQVGAPEQANIGQEKAAAVEQAAVAQQKLDDAQARGASQQADEEQARLVKRHAAEERARLAQEKEAAEQARIAQEKEVAEQARVAQETEAAEQVRIAQERAAAEQARLAREADEQRRVLDAQEMARRQADEAARLAEQRRALEAQRLAEAARAEASRQQALEAQQRAAEEAARQRAAAEFARAEAERQRAAAEFAQAQAERERAAAAAQARADADRLAQAQRVAPDTRPAQLPPGSGAGPAELAGSGAGAGGTGKLGGGFAGASLASRARDMLRGIDVLGGMPPPARPARQDAAVRRRLVSTGAERDVPLRMYIDSFRQKIERNGLLNGAQVGAGRVRIDPVVSVAVRSDGSVEEVMIVRSSGHPDVDEAVRRIVRLNERYSAFPANVAARYDVIEIRRIWTFAEGLKLLEEVR